MASFRRSLREILYIIRQRENSLWPKETYAAWNEYDKYLARQHDIQLPEAAEENESHSLARLFTRTNLAKTIVNSTVTMSLAKGVGFHDAEGKEDKSMAKRIAKKDVRRLLEYTSTYGAAWIHALPDDKAKPYRIHKPHYAVPIYPDGDNEVHDAVLRMEQRQDVVFERSGAYRTVNYRVAYWYEWDIDRTQVRVLTFRTDINSGSSLNWFELSTLAKILEGELSASMPVPVESAEFKRVEGVAEQNTLKYMPFIFVPNHEEDKVHLGSDIAEGIPLFQAYDDLLTKFLKALEDETFRLVFLSGVDKEMVKEMDEAGPLNWLYAAGKENINPSMIVAPGNDVTQHLDGLKAILNNIATVTRTSPLEIYERPTQDIPAQTLRVLYNPQIERLKESTDNGKTGLNQLCQIIKFSTYSPENDWQIKMEPEVPISQDKLSQENVSLLSATAISRRAVLKATGRYTDSEIDTILEEVWAEMEREQSIMSKKDLQIADKQVEGAVAQAEAQAKYKKEYNIPTSSSSQ